MREKLIYRKNEDENEIKILITKKKFEKDSNNIYSDIFKINNYIIQQKNLLPDILVNKNNFDENIAKCLNNFKYILEHNNNFSDFINDLFKKPENEIREFIGFDEMFSENNLPELITLLDTSVLSIEGLNNIINLFFIKLEKIEKEKGLSKEIKAPHKKIVKTTRWKNRNSDRNREKALEETLEKLKNETHKIKFFTQQLSNITN